VALSRDGQVVASASQEGTVGVSSAQNGRQVAVLRGHVGGVQAVSLSADGQLVATGGEDGTVRLWEATTGQLVRSMRADRRYERMKIADMSGVTQAQRDALLALGAVDRPV
jgi:WD40 repeat protein